MTGEVLPTMIPDDDDDPIVLYDVLEANLPDATLRMLRESGLTVNDVLAGNVPGLDPWAIVIAVWEEVLPEDEYARCRARLPDLLAEYESPRG
jgi:hypothetical protein